MGDPIGKGCVTCGHLVRRQFASGPGIDQHSDSQPCMNLFTPCPSGRPVLDARMHANRSGCCATAQSPTVSPQSRQSGVGTSPPISHGHFHCAGDAGTHGDEEKRAEGEREVSEDPRSSYPSHLALNPSGPGPGDGSAHFPHFSRAPCGCQIVSELLMRLTCFRPRANFMLRSSGPTAPSTVSTHEQTKYYPMSMATKFVALILGSPTSNVRNNLRGLLRQTAALQASATTVFALPEEGSHTLDDVAVERLFGAIAAFEMSPTQYCILVAPEVESLDAVSTQITALQDRVALFGAKFHVMVPLPMGSDRSVASRMEHTSEIGGSRGGESARNIHHIDIANLATVASILEDLADVSTLNSRDAEQLRSSAINARIAHVRAELDALLSSRSWKLTQPLRSAVAMLHHLRREHATPEAQSVPSSPPIH